MGSHGVYLGDNKVSPHTVLIVLLIPNTMATNVITYNNNWICLGLNPDKEDRRNSIRSTDN